MKPRASLREALTAGLRERERLTLFAGSMAVSLPFDASIRSSFADYVALVWQTPGIGNLLLGVVIIVLAFSLLSLVVYIGECLILYGSLRFCIKDRPSFASARSLAAVGSWITTTPIVAAQLIGSAAAWVMSPAWDDLSLSVWLAGAVVTPYLIICVSETAGISLVRSTAVLLIATAGTTAALTGLNAGLDLLIEVLHGLVPDEPLS